MNRTNIIQTETPYQLQRLGVIMRGEPGNPHEVMGVLNPAVARGLDGKLYLFARTVFMRNIYKRNQRAAHIGYSRRPK